MTSRDWNDRKRTTLGMLLCGAAFHEVGRDGREGHDTSVLVVFLGRRAEPFKLPGAADVTGWRVAFGTDHVSAGTVLRPGSQLEPIADAIVVLEGVPSDDDGRSGA